MRAGAARKSGSVAPPAPCTVCKARSLPFGFALFIPTHNGLPASSDTRQAGFITLVLAQACADGQQIPRNNTSVRRRPLLRPVPSQLTTRRVELPPPPASGRHPGPHSASRSAYLISSTRFAASASLCHEGQCWHCAMTCRGGGCTQDVQTPPSLLRRRQSACPIAGLRRRWWNGRRRRRRAGIGAE